MRRVRGASEPIARRFPVMGGSEKKEKGHQLSVTDESINGSSLVSGCQPEGIRNPVFANHILQLLVQFLVSIPPFPEQRCRDCVGISEQGASSRSAGWRDGGMAGN